MLFNGKPASLTRLEKRDEDRPHPAFVLAPKTLHHPGVLTLAATGYTIPPAAVTRSHADWCFATLTSDHCSNEVMIACQHCDGAGTRFGEREQNQPVSAKPVPYLIRYSVCDGDTSHVVCLISNGQQRLTVSQCAQASIALSTH